MTGAGLVLGVLVGACHGPSAFVCTADGECMSGSGAPGVCEANGLCSFPDDVCDSGRRYGEHAGGLSGECVDGGAGTLGSSGPGEGITGGLMSTSDGSGPEPADSSGGGGPLVFVDDDEADFSAGQWDGVVWKGGGVQLDGVPSGGLSSRVFDAGAPVTWSTIAWSPRGPYGKPLPDDGHSEVGYPEGNVQMDANVLLLHLDGEGTAGAGSVLLDTSGHGNDFVLETRSPVPWVSGRIGAALADGVGSYAHNGVWVDDFEFGEGDFSWAMWVSSESPCDGPSFTDNQVYLGIEGSSDPVSHLWLGCRHPTSDACPEGAGVGGRPGGTYETGGSAGPRLCGASELIDSRWHHLAVTKAGHADAQVILYLDGQVEDEQAHSFAFPVSFPVGTELALGAFTNGDYPAAATLDEVAIWRRALSANEVRGLVRRGSLQLSLQVRACADPRCASGEPFVGPSGVDTWFVDPAVALGPGTVLSLPAGLVGRYFQYRVALEGLFGASPVLESVVIEAQTP